MLRNFSFVGIVTILIWLLSPLGGQAMLRLLSTENAYSHKGQNVTYLGPHFLNGGTELDGASSGASAISYTTTLYLSSLMTPSNIRASARDLWGNPKTPSTKSLIGETDLDKPQRYMNLVGVPVKPVNDGASYQFVMTSVNADINCSSLKFTNVDAFRKSLQEPLYAGHGGGGTSSNGSTTIEFQRYSMQTGISTNFLYMTSTSWAKFEQDTSHPISIYYGSRTDPDLHKAEDDDGHSLSISLATCTLSPVTLETNVNCNGRTCGATAVRNTQVRPDIQAVYSIQEAISNGAFCGMGASGHSSKPGLNDLFITDPDAVVGSSNGLSLTRLWDLPLLDFEERFTLAFNAFWYAATDTSFSTGIASQLDNSTMLLTTPTIATYNLGLRYKCNWAWLGLALAIVLLLEVLTLANAVMRYLTYVPDVFGYVSSLTISNSHCELAELVESSALDGLHRARNLGEVRFRLADVRPDDDVGRIGFVPLEDSQQKGSSSQEPTTFAQIKLERWYD